MQTLLSKRLLALYFPELPLDILRRRDDSRLWGPFAIAMRLHNAERIVLPNASALQCGVVPDMTLADACAVCPNLLTEPRDKLRESRLLLALHKWADRFSPRISVDTPDGLMLDVTGCAHLFGGEDQLAEAILEDCEAMTIKAQLAIANTRRAARSFAKIISDQKFISDPDNERTEFKNLPISALELDTAIETELDKLGIVMVGDLARFKSSELARRFSVYLPKALDELFGYRHDPVVPSASPKVFAASMSLPEEISHTEGLMHILKRLTERVCTRLSNEGYAARGFALFLRCVDGQKRECRIGFARANRDVTSILRQFAKPVETLQFDFGVEWLRLLALEPELFVSTQIKAGDAAQANSDSLDQTLTTLGNRLGFDRLYHPISRPGHQPEREFGFTSIVDTHPPEPAEEQTYPRPERIFNPYPLHTEEAGHPPKQFRFKGKDYRLISAKGPERIAPYSWDDTHIPDAIFLRDYWRIRAEDFHKAHRLFWLMCFPHHPEKGWYLCGEFIMEPKLELIRC